MPADLSISGFNNQDICEMTTPGLTSVDQQIDATIVAATEVLQTQIKFPARTKTVIRMIPPALIVRGSTGKAPA